MITQHELKERLHYNPDTGIFTRLKAGKRHRWSVGKATGAKMPSGHLVISIQGKKYYAHRLAFLYMTGKWPQEVDHINHDPADNRWCNIRNCTHRDNMKSRKLNKNNKSGHHGVWQEPKSGRWHAYIKVKGRRKFLGSFANKADAVGVRETAEQNNNFCPNHGKNRRTKGG